jgi:hypothetical protein
MRIIQVLLTLLIASAASAEFVTNGFFSVYGRKPLGRDDAKTTYENNFDSWSTEVSEYTKFGLNFRNDFDKNWAFAGQLVASGARTGFAGYRWAGMFDWIYLSYLYGDVELKFGRQLFPSWLVSEYVDVGVTYPWYRPPRQLYTILPFKQFEGLSANYQKNTNLGIAFARFFAGNGRPIQEDLGSYFITKINDLYGMTLGIGGMGWTVQGTLFQYTHIVKLQGAAIYDSPPLTPGEIFPYVPVANDYYIPRVDAYSLGLKYDKKWVLYAEYGKACCSNNQDLSPSGVASPPLVLGFTDTHGWYVTGGRRMGKFLPHYTRQESDYGLYRQRGVTEADSFGLNYQFKSGIVAKIDYSMTSYKNGPAFGATVKGKDTSTGGDYNTITVGMDAVF